MKKIMISIALVALMLTGCSQKEGKTTAVEDVATDTVATIGEASADATTAEVVEEPAPEKETLEVEVTTEVPATTEIGGGKKKAEETTEEKKQSTSSNGGSGHSSTSNNSGSASSNGSNGNSNSSENNNSNNSVNSNSGNSGSSNSGNSGSNNSANSGSNNSGNNNSANNNNAGNNTPQHQHNYNVWVKTKDAYDEKIIDQAAYDETIEHPEEGYWADAVKCRMCGQVFTSIDALAAHPCGGRNYGTADDVWVKTKDAWTETKHHDEKSQVVHHDEEGYWKCECGARK